MAVVSLSPIKSKTGAIQVRIIVLISILVVVRKLMLLDYNSVSMQTLLGLSALLLSLGLLYWLITWQFQNLVSQYGISGGKGGDVALVAVSHQNTLLPLRYHTEFRATRGTHGGATGPEPNALR